MSKVDLNFDSGGTLLDGDPWLPTVLNMLADIPLLSHHKRSDHGCFGRPGAQGSAISAFNPLAAQRCGLHRQGFLFLSL